MNTNDFLQLSQRNIFHTFVKCKDQSDPKYIPNYAPTIIVEFHDKDVDIKDFNTKKSLITIPYVDILTMTLSICSRLMAVRLAPTKMYDIEYIIKTNEYEFHLESKNAEIWKEILKVLNEQGVKVIDPLQLVEGINNCSKTGDFYDYCQKNMIAWKEKYHILDPKVGDLINK